jgi:hypothetical protein
MGLADHYWESNNNFGHSTIDMEVYENDIMTGGENISINHYKSFLQLAKTDPGVKMNTVFSFFFGLM